MRALRGNVWKGGYAFRGFDVRTTGLEFAFSRRRGGFGGKGLMKGSNLSAVWTARGLRERLIGGVLAGRKAFSAKGASAVCKKGMWKGVLDVVAVLGGGSSGCGSGSGSYHALRGCVAHETYAQFKRDELFAERRRVKEDVRREALRNWVRNGGDDFSLQA